MEEEEMDESDMMVDESRMEKEKQFICDQCDKQYVHLRDLNRHKSTMHMAPRASKRRRTSSPVKETVIARLAGLKSMFLFEAMGSAGCGHEYCRLK